MIKVARCFNKSLSVTEVFRPFFVVNKRSFSMDSDGDFSPIENLSPKPKSNKRLSVERIYQKKSQLEHILLRPDTYIGSVEKVTQPMWVWDGEDGMVNREVTFVPGLYKIFDEILVNAADNKQRDKKMSTIKITVDKESNKISVWNDGKGIPVIEHKDEKMYVPEMIFGHLLTSSNYDDTEKKVTGGRNGYGAKLCNIFSTKFVVETSSKEYGKCFKMSWANNMGKAGEKKIASAKGTDFTCITFYPDLAKFGMEELDKDIISLLSRRAFDIAGTTPGLRVFLNGTRLPVKTFKDYVELYTSKMIDENGVPYKVIHDQVNPRWEVCLTTSDKGFQQVSFVNSIATTKGGRHTDYVMDQVVKKLADIVSKKNKGGVAIKPFQIKNHCWVFINCLIENPTFDSQTKENMTLQAKKFGSKCELTEKFLKSASNSGIVENIMNWVKFKAQSQLQKKGGSKSSKLKGIPKLDDANDAGTKNSSDCTLILTEGDSAKTLAVSGLSIVGRDKYGVFPLRGKVLNVRDATHKQIMENAEISNIVKIMGLQYKKKYDNEADVKSLRYGKIMIMTDQDHDGSHIKGLLINFIHANWPKLLDQRVLEEFITPIVKVSKGSQIVSFYSIPEFEEWEKDTPDSKTWKVKYYKGLGTSTAKEAKEYFADMRRHRIPFKYIGPEDDQHIDMAFNKKRADDRKDWLRTYMNNRKQRKEDGLAEDILYNQHLKSLSYTDFVNKELVLFSCADLERSIPSMVDGLKVGQRKVLFTCMKRNDKREVKVAQLAGSIAELSAYHHGEASLMGTIINMAQNFVGSNNINLLQPIGQFGTRLHGGKDAASPRYIFTMLSPLARCLFPAVDDNLLSWVYDDNQKVEPEWYCPIIPLILVNGSEGIGTGWSTKIPNHDARAVIENCRRFIRGDEMQHMEPNYKNFAGTIVNVGENRYVVNGEAALIDECNIEITELPVKTWTQSYKENVLEPMVLGTDKTPPQIVEYREYNTDTTVRFQIKVAAGKLKSIEEKGLHSFFKIQSSLTFQNTLVLFDQYGTLQKYANIMEIFKDFCQVRSKKYVERKAFLLGMITAETKKLENQARFINEKIDGVISIFNKKKKDLIKLLIDRNYDSDPVKAWKESLNRDIADDNTAAAEDEEGTDPKADFNYILNMPLWSLSKERKDDLLAKRDQKRKELEELSKKTPNQLWLDDLDKLEEELLKVEAKEREDAATSIQPKKKAAKGIKARLTKVQETMPSPKGIRIDPKIDPSLMNKKDPKERKKPKVKDPSVKKLDTYFKKEENMEDEETKEKDPDEFISLSDRLKNSAKKAKATKQATLNFKAKPKKDPWKSSEDEKDLEDIDWEDNSPIKLMKKTTKPAIVDSESEDEISVAKKAIKKNATKPTKTTTAPKRKKQSADEDEPPKKRTSAKGKKEKKRNPWSSDEEDSDVSSVAISDSDAEDEIISVKSSSENPSPVKTKTRKNVPTKKKAPPKKKSWVTDDSSDDDEFKIDGQSGDEEEDIVPRARSKRTTTLNNFKFHDSTDEDDDY